MRISDWSSDVCSSDLLLSLVVTEPPKAIRALKWAVEQMEDRYRMMASVGVRALSSFNQKVREAKIKGQPLGRRVQTGWDSESGQPIYEEETLDYEPLPLIVVVDRKSTRLNSSN